MTVEMIKAIWRYVILLGLFPVWWVLFFFIALFISVLDLIMNLRWEFTRTAREIGLGLNPIKMFIELESDLREEIKRQWKK